MKKRTSIMIETETLKQCKVQGVNMSDVCQRALESVLAGKHLKDEEIYLAHLLSIRDGYISREHLTEERLTAVKKARQALEEKIAKQKEVVQVIHRSRVVASLMKELNAVIISCDFDFEKVWTETSVLREQLEKEDHPITKEFLENHTEWLRTHI